MLLKKDCEFCCCSIGLDALLNTGPFLIPSILSVIVWLQLNGLHLYKLLLWFGHFVFPSFSPSKGPFPLPDKRDTPPSIYPPPPPTAMCFWVNSIRAIHKIHFGRGINIHICTGCFKNIVLFLNVRKRKWLNILWTLGICKCTNFSFSYLCRLRMVWYNFLSCRKYFCYFYSL